MKRMTDRRTILLAAGSTAAAAVAGSVAAQSPGIHGTLSYEGGAPIPKGRIRLTIEGAGQAPSARSAAEARLDSDGKATAVAFQIPLPARASPAPAEIVATLEREDGWLLARGSAVFDPGAAVDIVLFTVVY